MLKKFSTTSIACALFLTSPAVFASPNLTVQLGEVKPISALNELKKFTNAKLIKNPNPAECGGFLPEAEDEFMGVVGNIGIDFSDKEMVVTSVAGFDNTTAIYDKFTFDKNFKPSQLRLKNYEIFSEKSKNQDTYVYGSISKQFSTKYDMAYSLREKSSDDLLNVYFFKNKLVAVELGTQC